MIPTDWAGDFDFDGQPSPQEIAIFISDRVATWQSRHFLKSPEER